MSTSAKLVYRLPAIELRSFICKLGLHGYRPRISHYVTRIKPNYNYPVESELGTRVISLSNLAHTLASQNTERKDLP